MSNQKIIGMKSWKLLSLTLLFGGLMISCGGNADKNQESQEDQTKKSTDIDTTAFLAELKTIKNKVENNSGIPKEKDLKEAITKFQDFAALFPEDPEAPDYLFRASDICLTVNQPQKSVKILTRIIKEYPDYSRMEDVKYNKASHLDFELRDTTAAKKAYREFIEEYPNSTLVKDCESRIENIRYSAEELAEKFLKDLEASEGAEQLP